MRTLAGWCVNHRRLVLLIWGLVLVVSLGLSNAVGTAYSNSFNFPKTESFDAIKLLQASAPKDSGDTEQIVFATSGGAKVTDPAVKASIDTMIRKIEKLPHVGRDAPTSRRGERGQHRRDGRLHLGHAQPAAEPADRVRRQAVRQYGQVGRGPQPPGGGLRSAGRTDQPAVLQRNGGGRDPRLHRPVPRLRIVLRRHTAHRLGALRAGHRHRCHRHADPRAQDAVDRPDPGAAHRAGCGVDYALFIVTRHRQGLVAGQPIEKSIINAVNTSGRAVLFAGIIVCIALLGMFALGVSFLYGLAVSAAIGVLFTMISALTLLPAMLGFIGPKVMSRKAEADSGGERPADRRGRHHRVLAPLGRSDPAPSGLFGCRRHCWSSWSIALPFFSFRLGSTDQGSDPTGTTTRDGLQPVGQGLRPGLQRTAPAGLRGVDTGAEGRDRPGGGRGAQAAGRGHRGRSGLHPEQDRDRLGGRAPQRLPEDRAPGRATDRLIHQLRDHTIPAAVGDSGVKILVGGETAIVVDFAHVLSSKLPLFIALVVILSFILLAIVFRSFVIPLTAAVMNLLSIGAAFGILVAVYQWGYMDKLFGIDRTGPVESFIPVLLFAILFGLSMDYQVFLVTGCTRSSSSRATTGSPCATVWPPPARPSPQRRSS